MKLKSRLQNPSSQCVLRCFVSAVLFFACVVTPLVAADKYLAPKQPDGIILLAAPPVADSAEQRADFASARAVFKNRTPEEEKRAIELSHLNIFVFAPAIGTNFTQAKFPKTEEFFVNLKPEIRPAIFHVKDHYKRKRPYELDSSLSLGEPEASYGYPSGHSTIGTVHALLLAELFPEKRDAILAIGRDIGWSRVIIGKHFPTDVYAGRVMGQAIVRELLKSPEFQKDFAQAKAEVQAAKQN